MKKIFLIAALFAASVPVFAQKSSTVFDESAGVARVGIGVGGGFYSGSTTIPAISLNYEKGVTSNISVGGIIGYSASTYNYGYIGTAYEYKYTYLLIGARGNYHLPVSVDKLDPYGGLTLGYNIVSATVPSGSPTGYTASASALIFSAQVGVNYYFSDKVGGFAELGTGDIGIFTIGVAFKL
jgi:hypothetical protein